jgi:hypothetical protein
MAGLGLVTWVRADGEEDEEYATGLGALTCDRYTFWGQAVEGRRQGLGVTVRGDHSYSGPFKGNRPDTSAMPGVEGVRLDRQGRCRQEGAFEAGELVRGRYAREGEEGAVRAEGSFGRQLALHGEGVLVCEGADGVSVVVARGEWAHGSPVGPVMRWETYIDPPR